MVMGSFIAFAECCSLVKCSLNLWIFGDALRVSKIPSPIVRPWSSTEIFAWFCG